MNAISKAVTAVNNGKQAQHKSLHNTETSARNWQSTRPQRTRYMKTSDPQPIMRAKRMNNSTADLKS
jgi:hypothetical protein